MNIFGRSAACLLAWTIAASATPGQDIRTPETQPKADAAALFAAADDAFAAAEAAEASGRPALFTRTAYADAETAYRKAAEAARDPASRGRAMLGAGWAATRAGRLEDGLAVFALAEGIAESADDAVFAAARAMLEAGRRNDARLKLSRYLDDEASSHRGDAALLVLTSRIDAGERAEAAAWMRDVVSGLSFEGRTEAWGLIAGRWRDLPGDSFYADLSADALKAFPDDPAVVFWSGDLFLARRRFPEALARFRRFSALRPTDPVGRLWTGVAEVRNGLPDRARISVDQAAAAGAAPELVDSAYREIVFGYFSAKRWDDAVALQKIVCDRTDGDQDRLDLANLLKDAGLLDEAAETLERLLSKDDFQGVKRAKACNDRALLERARGRMDVAEAFFRAAIAAFEDERDARENLGILLMETGRKDEGRKLLEWCVARENNRFRSRYFLFRDDRPIVDGPVDR